VHAELQGQPEKEFSERLFVYNYRIFDKFRLPVVTLAVLTDKSDGKWCNPEFGYSYFGCDMRFSFPLAKLTDLRLRIAELENSENPLSVVVLAHLATQDTRRDYDKRLLSKVEMVRILLRKGFSREVVRELFRLMDWLLYLPEQYKQLYFQKVQKIQEETAMQFVDCFEERGIAKGIEKGIAKGIEKGIEKGTELGIKRGRVEALQNLILENLVERFNAIVQPLTESIRNQTDMIKLRQLANASITVQSLSEFETLLAKS
jgi:hypothetical protein